MAPPQIRIFPHSQEEFSSEDSLVTWLLNGLRARGGLYHLRSANAVKDLPRGSIVLFRYGPKIVGEAVVQVGKEVYSEKLKDRTLSGEEVEYEAQVIFATSSIRLYAPPVQVDKIEPHTKKDLTTFAGAKTESDWNVYGRIMEEVVLGGGFIS